MNSYKPAIPKPKVNTKPRSTRKIPAAPSKPRHTPLTTGTGK